MRVWTRVVPRTHWLIRLQNANTGRNDKVFHLAASDENGAPRSSTLCRKRYDPANRIEASRGIQAISGRECTQCLAQLGGFFSQIYEFFRSAGSSEEEAETLADDVLELRRTSKAPS